MKEKIDNLIAAAKSDIEACASPADIAAVKVKYLGKSGELTALLRGMKDVPAEQKPQIGKYVNEARDLITALTDDKQRVLEALNTENRMREESIDVTYAQRDGSLGSLHPCTLVKNEIVDIFTSLGFKVARGPEIELDFFNFQSLNIPKDHPARDMQDTFYIGDDILLRTHTSPVQARTMMNEKPPIAIVVPGKVYRPDDDATHSPMFQQIEGLVVDKHITLCDLKGTLTLFAKELFTATYTFDMSVPKSIVRVRMSMYSLHPMFPSSYVRHLSLNVRSSLIAISGLRISLYTVSLPVISSVSVSFISMSSNVTSPVS